MSGGHCGPACGYCGACGGVFEEVLADAAGISDARWTPSAEGWREMSIEERMDYLTRPGFHANSLRLLASDLYHDGAAWAISKTLADLEYYSEHDLIAFIWSLDMSGDDLVR